MEKKYSNYMMEQMSNLISIDSPTGYTKDVQQYVADEMARLGYSVKRQNKGGMYAELGGEGEPILVMAHLDTLGAMVDTIKPDGRLKISNVGGLQPNNIETENVRVRTRFDGAIEGTVQLINASAHVNKDYASTHRDFDTLEVVLDENVKTAADVEKLGVRTGDYVCMEPRFRVTEKGYVKSRFLDDKCCAAVLMALAKYVKEEKVALKRKVYVGFTVYEEVGHGGAAGIPDDIVEVMAVDMGCVGGGLACTEHQVSICTKDARGPYNYECTTNLLRTAMDNNVDYALDVYRSYGSDADVVLSSGHDARHVLVGPGVYASHGYERTHMDGLHNTFDLIAAYLAD